MMTHKLPEPLAEYFRATNAHDIVAMSAPFKEGAVVQDEGQRHEGLSAIRAWMRSTVGKYDFQVEPLQALWTGEEALVVASVRGNFPGSPVNLPYRFTLNGQKIALLEIG